MISVRFVSGCGGPVYVARSKKEREKLSETDLQEISVKIKFMNLITITRNLL